jgi:hypothetical protein
VRWPFANLLRGARGGGDPTPGPGEGARSPAEPDPGSGPSSVVRPAAWHDLPPVQRAVGVAPLTAPSADFARSLAGRRAPEPMLAPLGHDVTVDGPAGLVSGIAVPLVQRAPSGPAERPVPVLPAPPAAGRGRPTARRTVTSVAAWPPSDAADKTADSPTLEGTSAETRAGPTAGEPAADDSVVPLRALPVAPVATTPPALSATRVADPTAPAPVLALARAVTPGAPAESAGLPAAASVPVTGSTSGSAQETGAAVPPVTAGADDSAHPVVARRTLGESRRLGLGAPLTGRPPSVATEAGRADLPVARLARPVDAPGLGSASAPIAPAIPAAAAAPAPLPRLVVARRATTAPGFVTSAPAPDLSSFPTAPTGAPDPGSAGTLVDSSATPAGEPAPGGTASVTRPLVGETPIGVSRSARDGALAQADAEGTAEPGVTAFPLVGAPSSVTVAAVPAGAGPEAAASPETAVAPVGGPEPAAGPRSDPASVPTISSAQHAVPAGPMSLAALQRSHLAQAGGEHVRAAGAPSATRTAPLLAPLVPGRTMRASQASAISTLGYGPTAEPALAIARLAIPSLGTGGGGSAAGPAVFGGAAGSAGARAPLVGPGRDDRPVVARAALAGAGAQSSAGTSAMPLAHSAVGTATPDALETGGPDGVVSWTAGAGFTTVALPPRPFVQRAVTIDEVDVTPSGEAAGPAASGASAAQAGRAGPTGAGAAGTDYEELAEQVYDKIRARLTTELLLDRERAGMLVDG